MHARRLAARRHVARALLAWPLIASLCPPARGQVLPGELLLNSHDNPDALSHFRTDGTLVQTTLLGTGAQWFGAGILPDGSWVTTRRTPSYGVNVFDGATGAEIASWDLQGFASVPGDVGVFSDGTFAVSDYGGRVVRFDPSGVELASWSVSPHPFGLLVDADDHVWSCDWASGVVWHTDDQGNKLGEFPTLDYAADATMADDGSLFITHPGKNKVSHYAQDGTFLGVFPSMGLTTTGIALGRDDTLWVVGQFDSVVRNFDQAGNLLGSFPLGVGARPFFLTIPLDGEDTGSPYCGPAAFNSTGQAAEISGFGSDQVAVNYLVLTAAQLPPNQFGYFLVADAQGFVPYAGGSQGHLCLGGNIGRFVQQVASSGPDGVLVLDVDLTALPTFPPVAVQPGETWHFQAWFRDLNPGPTSNFTDGLRVAFR